MRLQFLPGQQEQFITILYKRSKLSTKQLAKIAGIHSRSFSDWKKGKIRISLKAADIFCQKFAIALPENRETLIQRWKKAQQDANRIGGTRRFKKYGLATDEGRRKGGINSWIRRRDDPQVRKKYLNIISEPDESAELAEFMGILLGDGGLTKFQVFIYLNSETDFEYASYVSQLIKRLFSLQPTIHKHKKYKLLRVSVSSVDMIRYLLQKGLRLGNKVRLQVGVPEWILSKREYIKACIRGLMDTDGCFLIHRYKVNRKQYAYPKMAFANSSLPILEFVYQGLQALGFAPKKYSGKRVWLLNKNEVKRYLKEVGTSNYKPAVKKILESCQSGQWNGLLIHDGE